MEKLLYVTGVCCFVGLLSDRAAVLCSASQPSRWKLSVSFSGQGRADGYNSEDERRSPTPLRGTAAGEGFTFETGSQVRRRSGPGGDSPPRGAEGGDDTRFRRETAHRERWREQRRHSLYTVAPGGKKDSSAEQRQQSALSSRGASRSCADLARPSTSTDREGQGGSDNSSGDARHHRRPHSSLSNVREPGDAGDAGVRRSKSDSAAKASSATGGSSTLIRRAMQKFRRRSEPQDAGGLRGRTFDWLGSWHKLDPEDLQQPEATSSTGAYVMVLHSTGETHTQFRTQAEFLEKEELDKLMQQSMPRAIRRARRLALTDWGQRREILVGVWPRASDSD